MPPATGTAGTRIVPARPAPPTWRSRPGLVITVAALLGLGLRVFQLTRPGYLLGFTQYDDGVYIGNALRLVCLLYTSPSPRDGLLSRMPSSA